MTDRPFTRFHDVSPRFLAGLAPAAAKTIISAARQRRYLANSVIVNQGHAAENFFLLVSGRVRYFHLSHDGRKVNLKWLSPGDIFSPAAALPGTSEYLVSTEAMKDSMVLVWNSSTIRNLINQYPQLLDNILSSTHDYLGFYRDAYTSLACNSGPQRVAQVLANLANGFGRKVAGGTELEVYNEELADEANVNLFTVSRLLSDWQRKGILTKRRGRVLLRSTERLFEENE